MTERDAIAMLRERRALERIAASIGRQAALAPEWAYVLVAIADRQRWSAYAVTVIDPQLIAHAEAVLNAEPDPASEFSSTDWAAAWTEPH